MSLTYNRPSAALSAELEEVATAAQELLDSLTGRQNAPLPHHFPRDQLADMCRSLVQLPQGTAEGCRAPLEYARSRLPAIRREHIPIDAAPSAKSEALLTRGTFLDVKLANLISAITTALDEYRRSAAEEGESEVQPELGIVPPKTSVDEAISQSRALDQSLDAARSNLQEITRQESLLADDLKRQLEDVRGINRLGSAELRMPKVVVSWLRKTSDALKSYPEIIKKTVGTLRVGVDVVQVAYDRWHEFQHEGVHFIFEQVRKTATSAERIARILDGHAAASKDDAAELRTLTAACLDILSRHGSPMTAKKILSQFEHANLATNFQSDWPKQKPYKRISSVLKNRERKVGDVVNLAGGFWALDVWLAKGEVKKIRAARDTPRRRQHSEKTRLGMQAAKDQGRRLGAKPKLGPEQILKAERMFADGKTMKQISTALGVTPTTLYSYFPHKIKRRSRRATNTSNTT